ncbi:uncharacterized protein Tco025E_00061 [Trypanosoma conorhini]|uniref:Uncharacterized protein n=1 Tax=Trypanosoma conorhini TaxID=83891 RepID=A0A3R7LFZ8_9TRYP|nr:uncharacterized protein Tco025E_00061 [Trypanosoma conorhini]RNF27677.1 hypothetical protein Tco025E_00061 [Trypanosoma conorhini]
MVGIQLHEEHMTASTGRATALDCGRSEANAVRSTAPVRAIRATGGMRGGQPSISQFFAIKYITTIIAARIRQQTRYTVIMGRPTFSSVFFSFTFILPKLPWTSSIFRSVSSSICSCAPSSEVMCVAFSLRRCTPTWMRSSEASMTASFFCVS